MRIDRLEDRPVRLSACGVFTLPPSPPKQGGRHYARSAYAKHLGAARTALEAMHQQFREVLARELEEKIPGNEISQHLAANRPDLLGE